MSGDLVDRDGDRWVEDQPGSDQWRCATADPGPRRRRRADLERELGPLAANPTPDLAAAVTRLREHAETCERTDTGDGWLETPIEAARQMGADLRIVLGAVQGQGASANTRLATLLANFEEIERVGFDGDEGVADAPRAAQSAAEGADGKRRLTAREMAGVFTPDWVDPRDAEMGGEPS